MALTNKKPYFSIRRVLSWLVLSLLVYPVCLTALSAWNYLAGDGGLLFAQLHDFLYTFEYGSKRQALANLLELGSACLWAGLISLVIIVSLHLLNRTLLRDTNAAIRRTVGLGVLLSAAFALFVSPGIIGPIILIAALLAVSTSGIMRSLE